MPALSAETTPRGGLPDGVTGGVHRVRWATSTTRRPTFSSRSSRYRRGERSSGDRGCRTPRRAPMRCRVWTRSLPSWPSRRSHASERSASRRPSARSWWGSASPSCPRAASSLLRREFKPEHVDALDRTVGQIGELVGRLREFNVPRTEEKLSDVRVDDTVREALELARAELEQRQPRVAVEPGQPRPGGRRVPQAHRRGGARRVPRRWHASSLPCAGTHAGRG
jgi:hypothetical protein